MILCGQNNRTNTQTRQRVVALRLGLDNDDDDDDDELSGARFPTCSLMWRVRVSATTFGRSAGRLVSYATCATA